MQCSHVYTGWDRAVHCCSRTCATSSSGLLNRHDRVRGWWATFSTRFMLQCAPRFSFRNWQQSPFERQQPAPALCGQQPCTHTQYSWMVRQPPGSMQHGHWRPVMPLAQPPNDWGARSSSSMHTCSHQSLACSTHGYEPGSWAGDIIRKLWNAAPFGPLWAAAQYSCLLLSCADCHRLWHLPGQRGVTPVHLHHRGQVHSEAGRGLDCHALPGERCMMVTWAHTVPCPHDVVAN